MSRRAIPRGSQRATKPARRRARRPDLKSLVPATNAAEAQWVRRQGTRRGAGGGLGDLQGALNYAVTLAYGGRCDDALDLLGEAHRRYPRETSITRIRANVRMLSGDLSPAVWLKSGRETQGETRLCQPRWQGEPRPGETMLLWAKYAKGMGAGDVVQMARLVAVVKAQSQATVMLAVPAGMTRLFSSLRGVDAIVEPPLPTGGFETQCPIPLRPSLPGCEWTPERLAVVPYLFADDEAVKRWAPAFADRSTVHIGLHWRAVGSDVLGRQRSLSLSGLAPLLGTPRARFYSLQYNGGDELKASPEVVDLGHVDHPGERFVKTAAVMQHLDLLIACDSGPAHVAGHWGRRSGCSCIFRGVSDGACTRRRCGIQGTRAGSK